MCLILNIAAYRRSDRVGDSTTSAGRGEVVLFAGVRYDRWSQDVVGKPMRKPRTKSTKRKKTSRSP